MVSLKKIILGGMAVSALSVATSQAALLLTVSEPGFAPMTGTQTGNTITFIGPVGDFSTNIVIGFTNDNTPGPLAELQVESLDVVNNAAPGAGTKTLTVTLTDTNFSFPGGPGSSELLTSSLGGTMTQSGAGDSVSFQSTATPTGGAPATPGVKTFTNPVFNPATLSFNVPQATVGFISTGSYSLSSTITATFSAPGETDNLSGSATVAAVPEPVAISMLALGGAGLLTRRNRRTV